ncbi:MAG: DNA-deoxyinosine glycosylase [Oscillospiraceae bacterium]|nr:DNA-deoxyinosine glycosylase [Oscillospiraceae bacterium]
MQAQPVTHAFQPVFDQNSRILVLGTMPSPSSRKNGFYYSHPRNRFWPVLAEILQEPLPFTPDEKQELALRRGIALWDVLASCVIAGADDASIRQPIPNDLSLILEHAPIRAVFTTGGKAHQLYQRYCLPKTGVEDIPLPSTSPANCRIGMAELTQSYRRMLDYL